MKVDGRNNQNQEITTLQNSAEGTDSSSATRIVLAARPSSGNSSDSDQAGYCSPFSTKGIKNFLFQQNRQKFEINRSTLSPAAWRTIDCAYSFTPVSPGSLTESMALEIVSRARERFKEATNQLMPTEAGICYVTADDLERFFAEQGIAAKCVRVAPKAGGKDHYFTVVKPEGGGDPLIVDATWRQFYKGGPLPGPCLVGTLAEIKKVLSRMNLNNNLLDMYAAGTKVVDDWDNYSCFQK